MSRASDARLSDADKRGAEEQLDKRKREQILIQKDFDQTFASPSGKRVLRWIMEQSGFLMSDVVVNPHTAELNEKSTWYNQAYRNFYLKIRKMITRRDILIDVEFRGLEGDEEIGNSPKRKV